VGIEPTTQGSTELHKYRDIDLVNSQLEAGPHRQRGVRPRQLAPSFRTKVQATEAALRITVYYPTMAPLHLGCSLSQPCLPVTKPTAWDRDALLPLSVDLPVQHRAKYVFGLKGVTPLGFPTHAHRPCETMASGH